MWGYYSPQAETAADGFTHREGVEQGLETSCLPVGFSLEGKALQLVVHEKNEELFFTGKKIRNRSRGCYGSKAMVSRAL